MSFVGGRIAGGNLAPTSPPRGSSPRADASYLRHSVSLLALLPAGIPTKKTGAQSWQVPCQFHEDSTPSMSVRYVRDAGWVFRCFGCGEHGSVIDYVMRTERLTFRAAVDKLAGSAPEPSSLWRAPKSTDRVIVCDGPGCCAQFSAPDLRDIVFRAHDMRAWGWKISRALSVAYCPACAVEWQARKEAA